MVKSAAMDFSWTRLFLLRELTVYDMITNLYEFLGSEAVFAQRLRQDKQSYDTQAKHFEVFIDGNVKFLNAVYWSLLPVPDV